MLTHKQSIKVGRGMLGLLLALGLHAHLHAETSNTPANATAESTQKVPVENFFKPSRINGVKVSPDGKTIAMALASDNGNYMLALYDVPTRKPSILARYKDLSIASFSWVNSKRIVYSVTELNRAPGEVRAGGGLMSVDIDGTNERVLISRGAKEGSNSRVLEGSYGLFDTHPDNESPYIYVAKQNNFGGRDSAGMELFRLNTDDGTIKIVARPCRVTSWVLTSKGDPRIAECRKDDVITTMYRNDSGEWEALFKYNYVEEDGINPEALDDDGTFYVSALVNKDIRALFKYDLKKRELSKEPMITLKGYDFEGTLIIDRKTNQIKGIRYETDLPGVLWLDERMKNLQKKVDDLLPGRDNMLTRVGESELMLVNSKSDIDPGQIYLMDTTNNSFTLIDQYRPWINPKQMAYVDPIKVTARDGLTIPGYITLPRGTGKNLPMVVLVHGGPNVRGEHWNWDQEAQFLASRGYAVLQVDYRGSTGYGLKHQSAGWRQWGLAMQDDVTDATRWAIAQGYADPKRICIAGASYGGYATLWGLIKEPDLYRCGISWVGVTDVSYLYTMSWSDSNDAVEKFFLPKKAGALPEFQAQFDATSAVVHAAKLKQPLILAYGGLDRRVPIEHGTRFMKAIKGHNDKVQWIEYPNEGHGWRKLENNVDFWTKVERFLEENLR